MFKINSQIEITREEDSFIKKTGYNPTAGSYICPYCKQTKHAIEFYDHYDSRKAIEDLLVKRECIIDQLPLVEGVSFIRKFNKECSNCQFPIDAEIVFFIKQTSSDWEIESEICDSSTLEYFFNSFLSLGIDIYSILPSLILRWWKKNYQIDIVVPFINAEYFELFENTGKYFLSYDKRLSDYKQSLSKNPFRYIVFRKVQQRFREKERKLQDVINDYYKNVFKKNGEDYFYLNHDGVDIISNSIFQVVNCVKENVGDSLSQKYSGNFHAKFIAGISKEKTELYLMSYNFGDIESLQFETHYLTNIDSNDYLREMSIFMEYHRLQIEKLKR